MQSQLACSGCRNILLYPRGATDVRCAVCHTVTHVQQSGWEMDQLICAGCRTLLMYSRGATSVRCLCCHTVNLTPVNFAPAPNQAATINCGGCHTRLMYPSGASSVKCAVCQCITNVGTLTAGPPSQIPSTSRPPTQTVVVENPMSRDESGKLTSNVVVGVTTERK